MHLGLCVLILSDHMLQPVWSYDPQQLLSASQPPDGVAPQVYGRHCCQLTPAPPALFVRPGARADQVLPACFLLLESCCEVLATQADLMEQLANVDNHTAHQQAGTDGADGGVVPPVLGLKEVEQLVMRMQQVTQVGRALTKGCSQKMTDAANMCVGVCGSGGLGFLALRVVLSEPICAFTSFCCLTRTSSSVNHSRIKTADLLCL